MIKIFVRFLIIVGVVYFCGVLFAQNNENVKNEATPTVMVASPCQVNIEALKKAEETRKLDSLILESEPSEVKSLLISYVQKHNIDIELIPKYDEKPIDQNIYLFGLTIHPARGIEKSFLEKVEKQLKKGKANQVDFAICILQFERPLSYRENIELCDFGVKTYEPLGIVAEIARIPLNNIVNVSQLPYVKWIGEYKKEYKFSKTQTSRKPEVFIYIFGTRKPEYDSILNALKIVPFSYNATVRAFTVKVSNKLFSKLAEFWWIKRIERNPEQSTHSLNFQPDDSRQVISGFKSTFTGSGVNLGIMDGAVWTGHPDLSGVFISGSEYGTMDRAHGTHTTSTILGRGTRNIEGEFDAKGVATAAQILFMSFDSSYLTALSRFNSAGIMISNHSWGFVPPNNYIYDANTANFDNYSLYNDMLFSISAGNDGPGSGTVTNPGLSKNCIAVGAIEYVTGNGYTLGRVTPYSSRGPTSSNRLKPEIIAPGGDGTYTQGVVAAAANNLVDTTLFRIYKWRLSISRMADR